uniref:CCHC-type domain-containing protein n=1 Tax=Peronospora matthiolae TaxID=2874970 RepID=A0AAV1T2G8_9STRA
MDLCYIESENSRSLSHKRTARCHRCQKIGHYAHECSVPSTTKRPKTGRDDRRWPRKGPKRGSDHVAKPRQQVGPSKKRSGSVGAEHPADPATSREFAGLLTKIAPNTQSLCVTAPSDEESLITLKIEVTSGMSLRALVDCGASNSFIRRQSLDDSRLNYVEREFPPMRMTACLATGASVTVNERVVGIHYTLEGKQYDDEFVVLDVDDRFDVILVRPWLRKYQPWVSWQHQSVKMPAVCSSDGHLMNVLERPQACGCTTSECDGLTCGTVVSTITRVHSVEGHYTVESNSGTCVETQAAPKVHHSKRSSGLEHGCTPRRVHPRREISVVQDEQHVKARSTIRESIVEQARSTERESIEEDVTVVVHPQSVHVMEESSSVPESDNSRESYVEGVDPQPPADVFSQEITETVNVLVNDGSSVGAYTLDLVTPPEVSFGGSQVANARI